MHAGPQSIDCQARNTTTPAGRRLFFNYHRKLAGDQTIQSADLLYSILAAQYPRKRVTTQQPSRPKVPPYSQHARTPSVYFLLPASQQSDTTVIVYSTVSTVRALFCAFSLERHLSIKQTTGKKTYDRVNTCHDLKKSRKEPVVTADEAKFTSRMSRRCSTASQHTISPHSGHTKTPVLNSHLN